MLSNLWEIKENEKVCVLDLDDILADSIPYWVAYVNKNLKTSFSDLNELKSTLPFREYKNLKTKYRESGEKINIPTIMNASLFTKRLKSLGYIIVILTRRPLYIHKCLFQITKKWLEKNEIVYDVLLFEEKKHLKIMGEIENIEFFVEDNRYICNSIAHFGIRVFLLDNIYNQGELNENVIRVKSLKDILEYLE